MTITAIPAYDKEEEEKGLKSPALGGLKCNIIHLILFRNTLSQQNPLDFAG